MVIKNGTLYNSRSRPILDEFLGFDDIDCIEVGLGQIFWSADSIERQKNN